VQVFRSIAFSNLGLFLSIAAANAADVVIHNPSWNSVTIQVRVGNNGSCDQNAASGPYTIARGAAVTITTNGEDVCWRRDLDPDHPTGSWTQWNRQSVGSPTAHYDVNV
jgi:hypothetical protein